MIDRCATRSRARRGGLIVLAASVAFASSMLVPSAAHAGPVTWGTGYPSSVGVATTVSLGGGSTVDLTVTTGGTQGLTPQDLGPVGATETGLDYSQLRTLAIFNGGGTSSVTTTLTFTNFNPRPQHLRGFIMVGAVDELSTPITVTSSVGGAVQGWTQVGSDFDISPGNSDPIAWNAASGQFTTATVDNGIDSGGIVVDVGSIAQYGTITLTLNQHLQDGIQYSFGEESSPLAPMSSAWGLALAAVLLAGAGASGLVRSQRPVALQR